MWVSAMEITSHRPHETGDANRGGFDALGMVIGSDGAEGHTSTVRVIVVARAVAMGDQRTPAHLLQRGHVEDIVRACAVIQSAVAAIRGGHDHHGRALLSGSLLVTLLGQGDGGGTMHSPKGP